MAATHGGTRAGSESDKDTCSFVCTRFSKAILMQGGGAPCAHVFTGGHRGASECLASSHYSRGPHWEQEERLIQLAGHLNDRALQERNQLLEEVQKGSYVHAVSL